MAEREKDEATRSGLPGRLGWLILIWVGSVLTLGMVAGLIRLFMNALGLETP